MTQRTDNDTAGGVAVQIAHEHAEGEVSAPTGPGTLPPVSDAPDLEPGASELGSSWRETLAAWLDRRSTTSLWLSVGVLVVSGVLYAIHHGTALRYADEHAYVAIAANLVAHGHFSADGVTPTAFQAPGWPLVLAPIHLLGGGIVAYRFANVVFGAVAVVLGWWLAREMGGRAVAALAAPMLALYPLAFYTMGTLYPETLASALFLAGLAAAVRARRSPGLSWWAVGAGASFGYLVLTMPNAWLPLVAVLVWLAFGRRRLWKTALCVLLVAVAVTSVWVVRNAVTFHQFIPVTDASGYNLLLANSEHASVRSGVNTDTKVYTAAAEDQGITTEVAAQNFYRSQAIDWMKRHPGQAVALYGERVGDYFAPFDDLATPSQQSLLKELVASFTYLPLLALFVLRLARWRRDPPGSFERLAIWTYVLNALIAALFVTRVRYRVPFDELLILVAASCLVSLLAERPTGRHTVRRGRPAPALSVPA